MMEMTIKKYDKALGKFVVGTVDDLRKSTVDNSKKVKNFKKEKTYPLKIKQDGISLKDFFQPLDVKIKKEEALYKSKVKKTVRINSKGEIIEKTIFNKELNEINKIGGYITKYDDGFFEFNIKKGYLSVQKLKDSVLALQKEIDVYTRCNCPQLSEYEKIKNLYTEFIVIENENIHTIKKYFINKVKSYFKGRKTCKTVEFRDYGCIISVNGNMRR